MSSYAAVSLCTATYLRSGTATFLLVRDKQRRTPGYTSNRGALHEAREGRLPVIPSRQPPGVNKVDARIACCLSEGRGSTRRQSQHPSNRSTTRPAAHTPLIGPR